MKKRTIALILIAVLTLSLFLGACANTSGGSSGGASSGGRKALKIAHVTKSLTNPFFVKIKESIENTVKELHPEDEVITYDCNSDINKEISIIEDCIAQKFDAVILAPNDYEGSAVSIKKLKAAGIICVLIDSGVSNLDECDFSVMSDNVGAGYLAMKGLAEAIGGKGKIIAIQASTSAPVRDRMAGRDKALEEFPDIEVVNIQDGKSSVDIAMEFMNNALQADPDIVGAWGLNDPAAQGFVAALKTAGKLDQVKVVGIDGSTESCDLIRKGEQLGTAAQFPKTMAKQTTELLYQYIEAGKKIETQHVKIPTLYVDKSNVDTFGAE